MGMKGEWTTHMTDTEKEQLKRYVDQRIRSRPNPIEMLALMTLLIQYSQNIQRERSQQQQTQHTGPVVCTMAVSPNTQTTYLEQYRQEELERQKKAKIEQSLAPVLKRIEEEKQKTLRRIESLKQSRQVQKQQPVHEAPSAPTLSPGEIEGLHREDRPPPHNPQSVSQYKEGGTIREKLRAVADKLKKKEDEVRSRFPKQTVQDTPSAPTLSPGEIERLHREDRPPPHNPQSVSQYKEVSEEHSKSTTIKIQDCCVCLEGFEKLLAITPCGHECICEGCSKILKARPKEARICPICRKSIEGFITIFRSSV